MTRRPRSRYAYRPRRLDLSAGPILAALGAPILFVAALSGLGHLLPDEQRASASLVLRESPEVLWQVLVDLEGHPSWRRGLTRVERLPDQGGQPAWVEYHGRTAEAIRIADARAPLRLVTERVPREGTPTATWTWELAVEPGGSRLTLTRYERGHGSLGRALAWVTRGAHREVDRVLADLAVRLARAEQRRTTALNR